MHRMTCKPGGERGVDLAVDEGVGLAELVPAFAVAEDDVAGNRHRRASPG